MNEIIECSFCGADAYLMGVLGEVEHYRCRHCGMDTTNDVFDECEFGMHEIDLYDDLDCILLTSDEELLKDLGVEIPDVS